MGHRFFDHTGDFGAELFAEDEPGIYAAAGAALSALLLDDASRIEPKERRALEVTGIDEADLLVALGNELLFLFETEGFLCAGLEEVTPGGDHLQAVAVGEPFDPERHVIARPMKAVTHHGAEVRESPDGWTARLIFDL